jgi:hypothetical protein
VKLLKTLHFQSNIVESEKINPLFTRVKIHVAYENENRNNSFISHETFNNAASSAQFCPIVGEFSEPLDDFLGHGGKIDIRDDSVKFVRTTMPYGCIGNESPTWETVVDNDGTEKEYFTLIGYVWSGRYPELETLINKPKNQSMEIEIINGDFENIDGKKLYVIKDMVFSGFCILGDDVEPCFENSTISTYSLDKNQFKSEFNQLLAELKFTMQSELNKSGLKGGNKVEENKKELVQEEFEVKEESPSEEVFEQNPPEEMPMHDDMMGGDEKEEMAAKEQPEPDGDEEGKDTDNDGDGKDEKYELLESEITSLKESYSLLESEVLELREFKAEKIRAEKEVQINAVFESVSSKLTEDELTPFKEKAFEMEVEDLKKELFALIGQKEFEKELNFNLNAKKPMGIALDNVPEDTTIANSYDAIIKKYNK